MVVYDAIIIGSGFGGSMAAHRLVDAGWRVLVLERGPWVERGPHNWNPAATLQMTPHYTKENAYRTLAGGYGPDTGTVCCVGGASVYCGAASFRYRETDFMPDPEIIGSSGALWPYSYEELEPYYTQAESLLNVAGDDAGDPTRPRRSAPYPQPPPRPAAASERFRDAARSLGLNPVPLPLAINYGSGNGQKPCENCRTCDTYACAIEAKNDVSVSVLTPLIRRGLEVRHDTVATGLVESGGRITGVQAWDKKLSEKVLLRGRHVLLAAGALGTPHLLLASDLKRFNPAGNAVGRYLMRHCSAMIFGFCNFRPDPERVFHKHFAVFDYYFSDRYSKRFRSQRLGSIQQISTPPEVLMKANISRFWSRIPLGGFMEHLTSVLVIAEDEPCWSNAVAIDRTDIDVFGMPRLLITHHYSAGDKMRRRMLVRRAKRILRRAGAWSFHTHALKTFSHAAGTVRTGLDPAVSPLDEYCRFRGIENLLVVDASALPTAGAVNPSLTIAANALRAADFLVTREVR